MENDKGNVGGDKKQIKFSVLLPKNNNVAFSNKCDIIQEKISSNYPDKRVIEYERDKDF